MIKKHYLGIFFACICASIVFLPNILFINSDSYNALLMTYKDNEDYLYLTRINMAYTGCILNCNPYIKEYNNLFPYFDSSLLEFILALPGIITNIPISKPSSGITIIDRF